MPDSWTIFRNNFVAQNQNQARYQMRKKDGGMGLNTKLLWADAGEAYRAKTGKPRSEHKVYNEIGKSMHKSYMYRLHRDRDAYKKLFEDEYKYMRTKKRHFTPYQLGYRGKFADNPEIRGAPQPKRTKKSGNLTIPQIKQILRKAGVQIPITTQKKAYYVNLLNQVTGGNYVPVKQQQVPSVRGAKSKKPKSLTINEMKDILRRRGIQLPIQKQKKRYYQNLMNNPGINEKNFDYNMYGEPDQVEIVNVAPPKYNPNNNNNSIPDLEDLTDKVNDYNKYVSPDYNVQIDYDQYVSPGKREQLLANYPNLNKRLHKIKPVVKFEQ